jgi:hypothetical protein
MGAPGLAFETWETSALNRFVHQERTGPRTFSSSGVVSEEFAFVSPDFWEELLGKLLVSLV